MKHVFNATRTQSARWLSGTLALLLALSAAACGGGAADPSADAPAPVARVEAVRARQDTLVEALTAYGTVMPAPGAKQNVAVPYESRVQQVLVSPGQAVSQGTPLVRLAPSPDARRQIQQARTALETTRQQLKNVQQRYDLRLATRSELTQQQQAYQDAQARYASVHQGAGNSQLTASAPGLVSQVPVSEGALVSAGSPLVTLTVQNRVEVRLGVEPEAARLLRAGQRVFIEPAAAGVQADSSRLSGTVRSVSEQVDPSTRLVDVLVTPQAGAGALMVNQFVRGRIEVASARGLIVPRTALLPQQDQYTLFTIRGGRAFRHTATLGIETDSLVQVVSAGVEPGDSVAVLGNYELQDSMRVRTQPLGSDAASAAAPFSPDSPSGS